MLSDIAKYRKSVTHSQSYDRLKNCLIFPIGAIVVFLIFANKYVQY